MTKRQIKQRIKYLKNEIANSRSECPTDYADWLWEKRELEAKLKGGSSEIGSGGPV